MQYTHTNGKRYNISDAELRKSMQKLSLTKQEAVELWLEDNGIEENEIQTELDMKARKVQKEFARVKSNKKTQRERVQKEDLTKENCIKLLADALQNFGENVQIENKTKIVTFTKDGEHFTVNLVRNRQKK